MDFYILSKSIIKSFARGSIEIDLAPSFTSTFSIYEKNYDKLIKESEKPSTLNRYGVSKFDIEKKLKLLHNINVTIFRVPIVIGRTRSHRIGILFELIK